LKKEISKKKLRQFKASDAKLTKALAMIASGDSGKLTTGQLNEVVSQFQYYVNRNLRLSRLRKAGWSQPDIPERDMTRIDRERAMAMARQKIEESPIAFAMMDGIVSGIVGHGFRLSMRTKNIEHNALVEAKWSVAKDKLDIRQMRTWGQLLRCWNTRRRVDGDVGILRHTLGKNYRVQTVEAERLRRYYGGDLVDCGIDYDAFTGEMLRAYVGPRVKDLTDAQNKTAEGKPFGPDRFKLYAHFAGDRAEQVRGVSQLTSGLALFEDVEQIIDNMVQKVKNQAFIGLKFWTTKGEGGDGFQGSEEKKDSEDGVKRKHVPMTAGINLDLDDGENAEVLESKAPNTEFIPFIEFLVRILSAPYGFPLEMLLLNFTGLSYSGGRAMMELAKRRFRVEQDDLGFIASWVFDGWYQNELDTGGIIVPPDMDPGLSSLHRWCRPPWPYINPTDEVQAAGMALDRNFTTLEQILGETSEYDLEDLIEQRKHEVELIKAANLPEVTGQQVVVRQNPDELMKQRPEAKAKPVGVEQ